MPGESFNAVLSSQLLFFVDYSIANSNRINNKMPHLWSDNWKYLKTRYTKPRSSISNQIWQILKLASVTDESKSLPG